MSEQIVASVAVPTASSSKPFYGVQAFLDTHSKAAGWAAMSTSDRLMMWASAERDAQDVLATGGEPMSLAEYADFNPTETAQGILEAFLECVTDMPGIMALHAAALASYQPNVPLATSASVSPETAAAVQAQQDAWAKEATVVLTECIRAYRRGEKAYRAGLFDSGRLAHQYVVLRMQMDHSRANAVLAVAGDMAKYASGKVDVNRLILAYQSQALLAAATGEDVKASDSVPYGHFRDVFSRLVERVEKDTVEEHYVLLPGLETECCALFGECRIAGLSREDCGSKVEKLLGVYTARKADAARKAKQAASDAAEATAKAAAVVKAEREAAEREAAKALLDATAVAAKVDATAEDKAAMTAASDVAKAALLAKQEEERKASSVAEQSARDAAKAVEREAATAKAATKAADKASGDKPAKKERTAVAAQGTSLLAQNAAMAKAGTAKDVAATLADAVMSSPEPMELLAELWLAVAERFNAAKELSGNDALVAVLSMAKGCDALSKRGQQAANAGLHVMASKPSTALQGAKVALDAMPGSDEARALQVA